MSRLIKAHSRKKGLPPGTLMHIGIGKQEKVKTDLMEYTAGDLLEKQNTYIDDFLRKIPEDTATWFNIEGIRIMKRDFVMLRKAIWPLRNVVLFQKTKMAIVMEWECDG